MTSTNTKHKMPDLHKVLNPAIIALGILAVVTAAHAAQGSSGLSFFPPEPKTLVESSASYNLLGHAAPAAQLQTFEARTGISLATLGTGAGLLQQLGDHVGVATWSGSSSAIIGQIRISDLPRLTGSGPLASQATNLRASVHMSRVEVYAGIKVYRFIFDTGGVAYGCLFHGDAVLATDTATIERLISQF